MSSQKDSIASKEALHSNDQFHPCMTAVAVNPSGSMRPLTQPSTGSPKSCAMLPASTVSGSPSGVPAGRFAPVNMNAPCKSRHRPMSPFGGGLHGTSPTIDHTMLWAQQPQHQQEMTHKRGTKRSPMQPLPLSMACMAPVPHPLNMHTKRPAFPMLHQGSAMVQLQAPQSANILGAWGPMPLHGHAYHGGFHHPVGCIPLPMQFQHKTAGQSPSLSNRTTEMAGSGAVSHHSGTTMSRSSSEEGRHSDEPVAACAPGPSLIGPAAGFKGVPGPSTSACAPRSHAARSISGTMSGAVEGGDTIALPPSNGAGNDESHGATDAGIDDEAGNMDITRPEEEPCNTVSGAGAISGGEQQHTGAVRPGEGWAATALVRPGAHALLNLSNTPHSKPSVWWMAPPLAHSLSTCDTLTLEGVPKIITAPAPAPPSMLSLRAVDLSSPSYRVRRTVPATAAKQALAIISEGNTTIVPDASPSILVPRTDSSMSLNNRSEHQAHQQASCERHQATCPSEGGAAPAIAASQVVGPAGQHQQMAWYQQQMALLQQRLAESEQDRREMAASLKKTVVNKRHLRQARELAASLQVRVCCLVQQDTISAQERQQLRSTVDRLSMELIELRQQQQAQAGRLEGHPRVQELVSELGRQREENAELQEQVDTLFDETERLKAKLKTAAQRVEYDGLKISQLKQALRSEHATREHLGGLLHAAEARQHEHVGLHAQGGRNGGGGGGLALNFHDNTLAVATPDADAP